MFSNLRKGAFSGVPYHSIVTPRGFFFKILLCKKQSLTLIRRLQPTSGSDCADFRKGEGESTLDEKHISIRRCNTRKEEVEERDHQPV